MYKGNEVQTCTSGKRQKTAEVMVFNHVNIRFQRRILFTVNQLINHILTTMNEKCINSFNFIFHTDVNECLSINGNCSQICTNTLEVISVRAQQVIC